MNEEWFPLVNEEGETIGKATRKECHSGSKMLHPVVHLHIFNEAGDLYLQKRSMTKGITDFAPQFITRYVFESAIEKELVNTFRTTYDGPFTPDPSELDEGRFWPKAEILANMGKGVFTPNFEGEYKRLFM